MGNRRQQVTVTREALELLSAFSRVMLIQQAALTRITDGDFKHPAHAQNIARRAILDAGSYLLEHTSVEDLQRIIGRDIA